MPRMQPKVDAATAARLYREHGSYAKAARVAGCAEKVLRKWARRDGVAPAGAPPAPAQATAAPPVTGGVDLAGLLVCTQPRTDVMKQLIHSLGKARAYPIAQLAEQWGRSPSTVREHGRRFDCVRYVELQPGNWVPCLLHPDTAASRKGP